MILFSSLLTFTLLHSVGLVSGRLRIGLDGDLNEEFPRPTSEPLLSPDKFVHGHTLMETRLGYPRNGTLRRDLALGARQLTCNEAGYVLSCPITKPLPCCPAEHPICCTDPSSTVCCTTGTFCNGINTCCYNGQVPCTNPEGCCPGGTTCCGIACCSGGLECRNGACVDVARSSLSVASVAPSRPVSGASSRSLPSVGSARSKSSESVAGTGTTDGNGNSNSNVPLVGGVVGGVLGAIVLLLIGILLCRRNGGAPPIRRQPFNSQQPPSQPITPASLTFSMNSNDTGGFLVHNAPQPGFHPQQPGPLTFLGGHLSAGQTSPTSRQFATRPSKWVRRALDIPQDNHGGPGLQSLPTEDSVDSRGSYGNTLRGPGPTHYAAAPMTVPISPSDASGGTLSPPPPYATPPPVSERSGLLRS